jgi:tetratricopeptide (TPR) repeat protein
MKKTFLKIAPFLLLINFTFSQDVDISRYLYLLRIGNVDSVKVALDSLKKLYPNSPNLKFLDAILKENAEEAVKIYYDIVLNHPEGEYSDEALFKIFQFHYAKGDYEQAKRELERLKKTYPSSPYAGINVRFPSLEKTTTEVKCAFSIQVGAFTDKRNAEKEKSFFEEKGYSVELHTKIKDGKLFYLVWVGCLQDKKDAERLKREIKEKFERDGFIISSETR